MQSPSGPDEDPSNGFDGGGWAVGCWNEVMEQVAREATAEPYDLLLGRKTYDTFAQSFSNAPIDNPVAAKLNNATKYVVTSTLDNLDWNNSKPVSGNVPVEIERLKNLDGPLLQVHGSWQLIQMLLAHDLIDEFRIWTFPVVVGFGKRLFADGAVPNNLQLLKSDTCPTGAVMTIYGRK